MAVRSEGAASQDRAEIKKIGKVLRFTGDIWNDHACCVLLLHEDDINRRPEWTQRVVNAVVRSQRWMRGNRREVANLLSQEGGRNYTPHSRAILTRARWIPCSSRWPAVSPPSLWKS